MTTPPDRSRWLLLAALLAPVAAFAGGYVGARSAPPAEDAPAVAAGSSARPSVQGLPPEAPPQELARTGTGARGCSGISGQLWEAYVNEPSAYERCWEIDLNGDDHLDIVSALLGTSAFGGSGGIAYALVDGKTKRSLGTVFNYTDYLYLGEPNESGYRDIYGSQRSYDESDTFGTEWTRLQLTYAPSDEGGAVSEQTVRDRARVQRFSLDVD